MVYNQTSFLPVEALEFSELKTPLVGKIQRGAHKRGLKPQICREKRGEILPGKSGLFGANWRHFRAGRGLFGADQDQFLCTPQLRGKSRNCPERALFGPIGPFRAKPPFAKPPFGFPRFGVYFFPLRNIGSSLKLLENSP